MYARGKWIVGMSLMTVKSIYCSDECLWSMYSEEEYDELCQEDLAYWTEWYDE